MRDCHKYDICLAYIKISGALQSFLRHKFDLNLFIDDLLASY